MVPSLIVNLRSARPFPFLQAGLGALGVCVCGLALWCTNLGEPWIRASYDVLFRFGARSVTNQVAIIQLDNASYSAFQQKRGQPWSRALHAELLNKLTEDGCPLAIVDVFFRSPISTNGDRELAAALSRRRGSTVLMAKIVEPEHPESRGARVEPIHAPFAEAAEWGIGKANANVGEMVRQHWPFPAPQSAFPSLGWSAARLAGATLPEQPVEQWLRYYGWDTAWKRYSFHIALAKPPGFFTNTIVFIGSQPEHDDPGLPEEDKFLTPRPSPDHRTVGGVEIMATTFLNLMNADWLRRPPASVELLGIVAAGCLLGGGIASRNRVFRIGGPIAVALLALVGAVTICQGTNYWFPWLIVAGGQVPCALALTLLQSRRSTPNLGPSGTVLIPPAPQLPVSSGNPPEAPDYVFVAPPFGEGAFGKVWLVRNAIGQWQALKAVYRARFGDNPRPYDAEFNGIQQYKPISNQHLGLLTVDFVSTKKPEGYFYYVMELGDSRVPDWKSRPETYRPLDLARACSALEKNRLPLRDCVNIGIDLAEALGFLHDQGLTHRDIKPANIIFVNGHPKLADVGLVTPARPPEAVTTYAGTPGYMPPLPEPPGTKQADLYALGMVLFVISTGRQPVFFPDLKTSLVVDAGNAEFMFLNQVILQTCHSELRERYASAQALREALAEVKDRLFR